MTPESAPPDDGRFDGDATRRTHLANERTRGLALTFAANRRVAEPGEPLPPRRQDPPGC